MARRRGWLVGRTELPGTTIVDRAVPRNFAYASALQRPTAWATRHYAVPHLVAAGGRVAHPTGLATAVDAVRLAFQSVNSRHAVPGRRLTAAEEMQRMVALDQFNKGSGDDDVAEDVA